MSTPIILVHYIHRDACGNIEEFQRATIENPKLKDAVCYFIPTEESTRIECINPVLVSKEEYQKAKEALEQLLVEAEKTAKKLLEEQRAAL